jgi:N-acetylglutamate synthase-like GNAT family acetyltransferase
MLTGAPMIDLDIRKAKKQDKAPIMNLIKDSELFAPRLRYEDFMVAYRGENLVGVARWKTHKKNRIHELSNVGVKDGWRKCGIGSLIVSRIIDKAKYDTYLNTVNPGFYEKLGFKATKEAPKAMKKNGAWCKGCDKKLCTTMVRKAK